jgi:hypothetical protein
MQIVDKVLSLMLKDMDGSKMAPKKANIFNHEI